MNHRYAASLLEEFGMYNNANHMNRRYATTIERSLRGLIKPLTCEIHNDDLYSKKDALASFIKI